ncbi:MAG: electron transfer flavoprotein subunit alpha [Actinomycetota bacterium]|nr:electron transfer flavoprotein subunit alpha [Actinomycetota bacterium]
MGIKVILDKCTGCKLCLKSCPYNAISISEKKAVIGSSCTLCGFCVEACKLEAIVIEKEEAKAADIADYSGVWVFAEQRWGRIAPVVYELLGEGRKLADALETRLSAALLGENVKEKASDLITHGADEVYLVESKFLESYLDDAYSRVIVDMVREHKPSILLMGATAIGRSLAPKVAAMLETGLTADCTALEIDTEKKLLLQTRPAFGGNIMATIICPNRRPQIATVRPRVMKRASRNEKKRGEIIEKKMKPEDLSSRTRVLDFVEDLTEKVKLEEADIIVSGGRGLGGPENFKLVEELADVLEAAVGASRATVDAGWIPYSHQVGQTGKTVCPKLYIACGISGAIQHLAGMQTSDVIVAVNKDPEAPIFQVATYGIVGDLFEVIPALTAKFKEMLGG